MDWRGRKYYCVSFDWQSSDMRLDILKLIGKVKVRPYQNIPKQADELEERGHYQFMLGVPINCSDAVEYELRKAERNDDYCTWKEIKRDMSKKYFDVLGFEMPYRRCDLNPRKRCNHCMNC
jgi:hypothetical protein